MALGNPDRPIEVNLERKLVNHTTDKKTPVTLESDADILQDLIGDGDCSSAVLMVDTDVPGKSGSGGFFTMQIPALRRITHQSCKRLQDGQRSWREASPS